MDFMNLKLRRALVLLSCLGAGQVWASCIDAGIEKAYLQENIAALDAQRSSLAAKANRSRAEILLYGLAAYRVADLKLLKGDKDGASAALSSAASVLEARLEKGRDAELGAVLGMIYGMQIRISPIRGIWLGSSADRVLEDAMAAEPNNPRPHLAAGVNLLYKPGSFGGGPDKALLQLQRAIDLYNKSAAATAVDSACWGGDDALLSSARAKLKLGERVAAIALVETVLARSPENRPAQRLMNGIRGGPKKGR
jgi:tetratricopeptide (TPR) repeat protein